MMIIPPFGTRLRSLNTRQGWTNAVRTGGPAAIQLFDNSRGIGRFKSQKPLKLNCRVIGAQPMVGQVRRLFIQRIKRKKYTYT